MDFTKYLKFIPKIFHFVISFIFYGANLEIVHELSFWSSYTNLSWSLSCPPCQNSIFVGLIIYPPQKSGKGTSPFTNYKSNKATQIEQNPKAAALFAWLDLERQVKVEGNIEKISTTESLKYFLSRPKGSQIGAWVSHQSQVISSRSLLEQKFDEIRRKFVKGEVPFPDFWGGYIIKPTKIEFWQGGQDRLHDRFVYKLQNDSSWTISRLAP